MRSQDVAAILGELVEELRGDAHTSTAEVGRVVARLASVMLRAFEVGEMETRLRNIEDALDRDRERAWPRAS